MWFYDELIHFHKDNLFNMIIAAAEQCEKYHSNQGAAFVSSNMAF